MDTTPYKEYVTKGRPYWVHQDGTTTWDRPKVIQGELAALAVASCDRAAANCSFTFADILDKHA